MLDRVFSKQPKSTSDRPLTLARLYPLMPEWDLLVEIQSSLRLLPGVSVVYVKAHQDDQRPVEHLPLMAQLNVEADPLATSYQQQYGTHCPQVLMSPGVGVHLVSASGTITAKQYKAVILERATSSDLRQYVQEKNKWSESTFEMVNWPAHGKAFRRFLHCRVHLSKMLHECLPTFHQLNKFGGSHRNCPGCGHSDETRDHIIRCQGSPRAEWRRCFWSAIDKFHTEYQTAPLLRHIFRLTLEEWFQADIDVEVSPILFPVDVRKLLIEQNSIGWRQLFSGRFSIEWSRVQQEYYSKHRTKPGTSKGGNTNFENNY